MTAMITVTGGQPRPGGRAAGVRSHRAPVSRRTYARRRALVGGVTALFAALAFVAGYDVLVGSSGASADAAASRPSGPAGAVVARPGDTLWSIAESHRGDIGIRRYVDALIDLNGGVSIQAGQRVLLP